MHKARKAEGVGGNGVENRKCAFLYWGLPVSNARVTVCDESHVDLTVVVSEDTGRVYI